MRSGPDQLRDWIERRGFNYEETARHLGLDPSVVTKLANGTRNAGLKIALVIERRTGIPVEAWASEDSDTAGELVSANPRKRKSDK
jgi:transcriptional regulator with XRE-family HTH domain